MGSKRTRSSRRGWGSRFATSVHFLVGHVHAVCSCPPPRMLVGAPWDGPSGDRRGDVYRCPVGGSHNAPCAKGHLGKMPRACTPNP